MPHHTPYQIHQYGLPGGQRVFGSIHIWLRKEVHYFCNELWDTLYLPLSLYFLFQVLRRVRLQLLRRADLPSEFRLLQPSPRRRRHRLRAAPGLVGLRHPQRHRRSPAHTRPQHGPHVGRPRRLWILLVLSGSY